MICPENRIIVRMAVCNAQRKPLRPMSYFSVWNLTFYRTNLINRAQEPKHFVCSIGFANTTLRSSEVEDRSSFGFTLMRYHQIESPGCDGQTPHLFDTTCLVLGSDPTGFGITDSTVGLRCYIL